MTYIFTTGQARKKKRWNVFDGTHFCLAIGEQILKYNMQYALFACFEMNFSSEKIWVMVNLSLHPVWKPPVTSVPSKKRESTGLTVCSLTYCEVADHLQTGSAVFICIENISQLKECILMNTFTVSFVINIKLSCYIWKFWKNYLKT